MSWLAHLAVAHGMDALLIGRAWLGLFAWPIVTAVVILFRVRAGGMFNDDSPNHGALIGLLNCLIWVGLSRSFVGTFLAYRTWIGNPWDWWWVSGWIIIPEMVAATMLPFVVLIDRRWMTRLSTSAIILSLLVACWLITLGTAWCLHCAQWPDVP